MRWMLLVFLLLGGCGAPSLLITPVSGNRKLEEVTVDSPSGWSSDRVVLIEVEGLLINARSSSIFSSGENKLSLFAEQLEKAKKDSRVKAVVLRVNSPGGTVSCSDAMYELVQRFRKETGRPVVASAQEVAASGGYYVACAADRVVAQPTSVVGSIGVIFNTFDASGTMSRIGLRSEAIKSGPLKDMGSPFKPLSPREREVMQGMVDEYYRRFVEVVAKRAGLEASQVEAELVDGRVFSGETAKARGLVDEVGLLSDAIAVARKLAGSPSARVVMYKRPLGYSGSIYAQGDVPQPNSGLRIELPEHEAFLPRGFYYLWAP